MSIIYSPAILGQKWLRQFYGRLAFFGSSRQKNPMPIKFLLLELGFLEGGVEVTLLFLWAWGFFFQIKVVFEIKSLRRTSLLEFLHRRSAFQEPLNAPFLNGLFSSGFSRGKTAP